MPITESKLWSRYRNELLEQLQFADPSITAEELNEQLEYFADSVTVPIAMHETGDPNEPDMKMTLYEILDELEENNYIISAGGVIVHQHSEDLSPFVNMLIRWKKERGAVKKKMFAAIDAGDDNKARYYDKLQKNLKSNKMNALYGILALVSSAFFNEYVPNAVTSSGRQLISHSASLFESILAGNLKFLTMGECVNWIKTVRIYHEQDDVDSFVHVPDAEEVYEKLVGAFVNWQGDECDYLKRYVSNLSPNERVFVFYANYMTEFIEEHRVVEKLLEVIYEKLPKDLTLMEPDQKLWEKYHGKGEMDDSKWRKLIGRELFLDPYNPPESIASHLKKLREIIWKYVYVPFLPMNIVSRMNKLSRKAVAVADTDSNMIYTEKFTKLCKKVSEKVDTGIRGEQVNEMVGMMTIANIVDPMIVNMIGTFFAAKRIAPEYYPNMVMKNEWYYSVMLISLVKKRYAAYPMIQEGLYLPKPKPDIKGFDFKKAAIPKEIQGRMVRLLMDHILTADEPEVDELVSKINQMQEEIKESILRGETKYWKLATYKDESAYQHPERIQVWKGGQLWNQLYPDQKLESLDKAGVAKLKKDAMIRGMSCDNVIAVPMTLKVVPEEIVSQLDTDLMAYNIVSSFNSVLDCFEIETQTEKSSSGGKILRRKSRSSSSVAV